MSRARQVANFDPALFAADEVSGDKVHGGTISGSPTLVTPALGTPSAITLTNATFPAGTITGYTRTITTPVAIQGTATSNTTLTGSSVSYTPTTGASFVVYEYSAYYQSDDIYSFQLIHFKKNGSLVANTNWQLNSRVDGSFAEFSPGQVHIRHVMAAWSGAQTLSVEHQKWETGAYYDGRWHSSMYSGDDTSTDVYVDIYRTTYSVM